MDLRVGKLPSRFRVLPDPEQGIRALVEQAPRAEAFADRMMERARPTLDWIYSVRTRVATIAIMAFTLGLFLHVMFGANGMVVYRQKRTEYKALETEIDRLQKENEAYSKQINDLKSDPATIEKEAREQLHYARPGEVVYVAPPPPAKQTPPSNRSAKK